MTIIKWDPFRNMAMLQDRINRLFEDAFPREADEDEELVDRVWKPSVDIYASPQGVVVQMDLPGVFKEDVAVEIKNNQLIIQGRRQASTDIANEKYFRRERICGAFRRTFALRSSISPESIKASFKDGVLTIVIPEPDEEIPCNISVSID